MKQLLTAALVLASLLSAQAARADECQPVNTAQPEAAAPAPEPIVISWDRVGGKEKWWV
jgi:opacity protein-like surface antigen